MLCACRRGERARFYVERARHAIVEAVESTGAVLAKTRAAWASLNWDTQAAGALDDALRRECYFGVTALLATPPPEEFTQTVVGLAATVARKRHVPSAGLTEVVPMTAPGQVPATAAPSWIVSVAAKPPVGLLPLTPSTRSSPVPRTCWARLMVTVSGATGGGGGATPFTTCVTTADVLVRKSRLPL